MEQTPPVTPVLGNRYQLHQVLGSGGMAVVYQARDLMLERPVAVKILRQDFTEVEGFRNSFRQEARAAANLSHPNIVTVYDFGLDAGRIFIVMEHVPGTDLKTILNQRGQLPQDEAISLMVQACAGIGYAHRAGIVHCDVKPHNMLVSPEGRLKVTDFGIARALASIQPDEQHEVVWGSPLYFAPEQASGSAPSPASDVYSLGVVLYEMLTGQLPFRSSDPSELSRMHREEMPVPPRELNPDIPEPLEQIVLKVLSKEPSARYRTADQLGRVLLNFGQYSPTTPPAFIPPNRVSDPADAPTVASTTPVQVSAPAAGAVDPAPEESEIDWGTVLLGLLAVLAVGGLIPLYLYILLPLL